MTAPALGDITYRFVHPVCRVELAPVRLGLWRCPACGRESSVIFERTTTTHPELFCVIGHYIKDDDMTVDDLFATYVPVIRTAPTIDR